MLTHTFDKKKGHMQKKMNLKVSKAGEIWVEAADNGEDLGEEGGDCGGEDEDELGVEPAGARDEESCPHGDREAGRGEGSEAAVSGDAELKEFKEWTWSEPGDTIVNAGEEEFELSSGYDEIKQDEGIERMDARAIAKALREEARHSSGKLESTGGDLGACGGEEDDDVEKEGDEDVRRKGGGGAGAGERVPGMKPGAGGGSASLAAWGDEMTALERDLSWAIGDCEWERAKQLLQDGASTSVLDRHLLEVCHPCSSTPPRAMLSKTLCSFHSTSPAWSHHSRHQLGHTSNIQVRHHAICARPSTPLPLPLLPPIRT